MKTSELTHICPYTGLRSFTEEESLYFKGRDYQVDQITSLLEQNKFLMVTGASGEGKSSLIYAGLIPNARAGFFKARYTNWLVADFRPERSPVKNMAVALSDKFNRNTTTIETELRRGFSSLIDLYTNSEFYTDEEDTAWNNLSDSEKRDKKRKAANFLVIVDQFEEFFTNPENYHNEIPSQDSQIVVNLVLESARIAIKRNLPVYIVCTMRSDYIGQCSAFRGLPEYIGFSQFFVPRLKRKDLKQVIEEPAILSGNRISQRLIERLVYDIAEGVDQLPILQHALSQVWRAADSGREEMDLIHYAMVGGMPPNELPDDSLVRFDEWFIRLPESQKKFYQETGLNKVIEIHASTLYENAWEYYNQKHPERSLSQHDAKRIIVNTFCCLTKIDNSRAVRNRMTLGEITEIVNTPEFSATVIGDVINIFREEGNSFIRPFITEDPSSHRLTPETVLDITHESLIRNWSKLNTWAAREFDFYSTYLDFRKQLDRWKESGKSNGFLLPIGPLTYFEKWYSTCKPNVAWLRRYSNIQNNKHEATIEAAQTLSDIQSFLKQSARKVIVTRAFMKYGPQRIATVLAIIIMLVLSGFYWYDAEQKKNERVIERVRAEAFELMKSEEVGVQSKSFHLLTEERYQPGSLLPYLKSLDVKTRFKLAIDVYRILVYIDKRLEGELKTNLLTIINEDSKNLNQSAEPEAVLSDRNNFIIILARDLYYNPDDFKSKIIKDALEANRELVLRFYKDPSMYKPAIPFELNVAIQYWLALGSTSPEKIDKVTKAISPFSNSQAKAAFDIYYPKGSFEPNGRSPSDFNSGYHTLASLHAALGDLEKVEMCFNTLLEQGQRNYFELGRLFNNHQNILGYLYQYGHRPKADRLLTWIEKNTVDNPRLTVYRNVILRGGYISPLYAEANIEKNAFRSYRGYLYPNLYFLDRQVFDQIMEDYEKVIRDIKESDEREFQLAFNAKRKALYRHKYWYDRKLPVDEKLLDQWLEEAWDHYQNVSPQHLQAKVSTTLPYFSDGVRTTEVTRQEQFVYPDYRDGWFSATYHSDYFFNWLKKTDRLAQHFTSVEDLELIHAWIARAFLVRPFPPPLTIDNDYELSDDVLQNVLEFVEQHPKGKAFDKNLILLILANRAFTRNSNQEALEFYSQIDFNSIERSSNRYEYIEKIFFLNLLKDMAINLALAGNSQEAIRVAEQLQNKEERVYVYLFMAEKIFQQTKAPETFIYLDSAFSNASRVDFTTISFAMDSRYNLILLLSRIGSSAIDNKAIEILREIPENRKFDAIFTRVIGVAYEGNFYRARMSIPNTLTENQDLECRTQILFEACKKQDALSNNQQWAAMDRFLDWGWYYIDFLSVL
ncbi:MAG: ATP-binding protein [Cyclobacteriaceae bacterium]|nr:ATP-binding protein [Cyclobacteriaceae bacterium]